VLVVLRVVLRVVCAGWGGLQSGVASNSANNQALATPTNSSSNSSGTQSNAILSAHLKEEGYRVALPPAAADDSVKGALVDTIGPPCESFGSIWLVIGSQI